MIRIFGGNHNTGNASIDDRFRARTSPSPVAARLQADVHRRPVRELARLTQSENLRMRLTRAGMKSSPDHPTFANDDRAHKRVGARPAGRSEGKGKGFGHVLDLSLYHAHTHAKTPEGTFRPISQTRTGQPAQRHR